MAANRITTLILTLALLLFTLNAILYTKFGSSDISCMIGETVTFGIPLNERDTSPSPQDDTDISDQNPPKENPNLIGTKMIIAGFSDFTFFPVTRRWYDRLTTLGYSSHVIVATDDETVKLCQTHSYRYELAPVPNTATSRRSLWYQRISYTMAKISNGTSVLLTDVDNDFRRYVPLETFRDSGYDVIQAYEMRFPEWMFKQLGFVFCAGMGWYGATRGTLELLKLWEQACIGDNEAKMCNDQHALNYVYLKLLDMQWDVRPETHGDTAVRVNSSDTNNGLLEMGMTGWSPVTNHSVMVWDRDFAWRGPLNTDKCPSLSNNWMVMPTATTFDASREGWPQDKIKSKLYMFDYWDAFCGLEGINRRKTYNSSYDAMKEAVKFVVDRNKI